MARSISEEAPLGAKDSLAPRSQWLPVNQAYNSI